VEGGVQREQTRSWPWTEWVLTLLAVALVGGVYLIVWATDRGLATDVAISPYHAPAYAALATLLVWVVIGASRAYRGRSTGTVMWPLDDGPLLLGLGLLVAYIATDLIWREVAPIRPGIEGGVAPTRLLLAVGLGLVAGAPLRMARRLSEKRALRRLPAMVSAGVVVAGLGFALFPLHPAATQWLATPADASIENSEIWVMRADGSRQTRLLRASDRAEYSLPVWSPDGRQLAGTGWDIEGPDSFVAYVWTAAADGSGLRRITSGPGWQWVPAWSPDGTWVAYTVSPRGPTAASPARPAPAPEPGIRPAGGRPVDTGEDIWMIHPDGSGARPLVADIGNDYSASWSPDGSRLLFVSDRVGDGEIHGANADGTNAGPIVTHPGDDWAPTWSPDGLRIAFTSNLDGNDDIWLVNADGTGLRRLTHERGSDAIPAWSPDGRRIAFESDRTGDVEVWSMTPDGGELTNLSANPALHEGQWGIAWSPDGEALAYAAWRGLEGTALPVVREDLAVAGTILNALLVAGVAILATGLGFGATTILLAIAVGFPAAVAEEWRLVLAALVIGLLLDVVMSRLAGRRSLATMAGLTAAAFAAIPVLVFAAAGALYWSATLAIGVVLLAAGSGWTLGRLAGSAAALAGSGQTAGDGP
jgi:Tol biopolymer transport system component